MKIIGVDYEDGEIKDIHVTTDGENRVIFVPKKQGWWVPVKVPTRVSAFGIDEISVDGLRCSECGMVIDVSEGNFKYCPYCSSENLKEDEGE